MKSGRWRTIALTLGVIFSLPSTASTPAFDSFPVQLITAERTSSVDLASNPDAKRFRTNLKKAFEQGPQFAGHYAFAKWGCGANCSASAIVDVVSGKVTFGPVAENGFEYQLNSRLLIVNPKSAAKQWIEEFGACEVEAYWAVTSHYYEWLGGSFVHITDINWCGQHSTVQQVAPGTTPQGGAP
jgi:hypothetical protein